MIVGFGDRIAMEETLDGAMARVFGAPAPRAGAEVTPSPPETSYDLAQITIPTDNVDDAFIRTPQRWDIGIIQRFMVVIGPISSIYDFLTFGVLL